jgi:hypothetical protein
MDWKLAVDKNRERLLAIVMALVASLGLSRGGRLTVLPQYIYARALAILHPAEAAARRLIIMAAHELALSGFSPAPRKEVLPSTGEGEFITRTTPDERQRGLSFNLIEPLKTFSDELPDYSQFGITNADTPKNRTLVPAAALGNRLLALKRALDRLPQHAKRLCCWYRARDIALKQNRAHRISPMRPGLPPGWRTRKRDPIHELLHDCHSLANITRDGRGGP